MLMHASLSVHAVIAAALVAMSVPAGAQVAAPALRAGDSWTYRVINNYNKEIAGTWTREVTGASTGNIRMTTRTGTYATEAAFSAPGEMTSGVLTDRARGSLQPALQLMPFPLTEGVSWSQKVVRTDPATKEKRNMLIRGKVDGWEMVTVPAGSFKAIKVARTLYLDDWDQFRGITQRTEAEWYAPEVKGPVKVLVFEEYCEDRYACGGVGSFSPGERATYELTEYRSR